MGRRHGAYGVTVNTRVCGTRNLGSIPSRHPKSYEKEIAYNLVGRGS